MFHLRYRKSALESVYRDYIKYEYYQDEYVYRVDDRFRYFGFDETICGDEGQNYEQDEYITRQKSGVVQKHLL